MNGARLTRIRLAGPVLRELRLALLGYSSPLSFELELVEETYDNGDVVVRLARPDRPQQGERILGCTTTRRGGMPPDPTVEIPREGAQP